MFPNSFFFFLTKLTFFLSNDSESIALSENIVPGITLKKEFFKMGSSLFLLILILISGVWLFKKFLHSKASWFSKNSEIKILDRKQIGQKTFICIVEIQNKILVLSETPDSLRFLTNLEQDSYHNPDNVNQKEKKNTTTKDFMLKILKKTDPK